MHPLTLLLLNEKRGLFGEAAKVTPIEDSSTTQKDDGDKAPMMRKMNYANKIMKKLNFRK